MEAQQPPPPPKNIELYFTRHARSVENDGDIFTVDAPLSSHGKIQATLLTGQFDYIISSPMRRCIETLHYSQISYEKIIIDNNFRERIYVDSSRMLLEHGLMWESEDAFHQRVEKFNQSLGELFSILQPTARKWRVLLIGHSYFFNYWMGRPVTSPVENATIIRLSDNSSGELEHHHSSPLIDKISHFLHGE